VAGHDETTLDTIKHLKRREPFVPFNIITASGERYLIEDADGLAIATSQLHYYPRKGNGVHLRINQISEVKEMNERPAA
jgi:hypothetical protein